MDVKKIDRLHRKLSNKCESFQKFSEKLLDKIQIIWYYKKINSNYSPQRHEDTKS